MALSTLVTTASLHRWSKQYIEHQEGIRHSYLTTQPPPFQKAFQREQNPKIPSPNLFSLDAGSQALSKSHSSLPTVAECAVHLELLQAFQHFRIGIISSERLDRVLGIELNPRTVFRKVSNGYGQYEQQEIKLQDLTFDERRKTKWLLLLSLAAARFLKWVEVIEKDPAESILLPPIGMLRPIQISKPTKPDRYPHDLAFTSIESKVVSVTGVSETFSDTISLERDRKSFSCISPSLVGR
jgi:hypothetical protein